MANLSTQNIGANYKGILNLGSTINTPLSTTLQAITDGDGNTTPLQLATDRVSLVAPTLTGSSATSALSISQTWNTTGNPSLIFANVTNTASGASSNLMDLQVGGVSRFKVDKNGVAVIGGNIINGVNSGRFDIRSVFDLSFGIGIGYGACFTNGNGASTNSSALLEVNSTTKGFLPPRMTTSQKNAIASPAAGLMVYDTTLNKMSYYNGSAWVNF